MILAIALFVYAVVLSITQSEGLPASLISLVSFGFIGTYSTIRFAVLGMELTDVVSSKDYVRGKRKVWKTPIGIGAVYAIITLLHKGIPKNTEQTLDIAGPAVLIAVLLFFLNFTSLKKSYKKNKELIHD
ncbi:hypothetical protein [Halobacillus campisalis]|uniref:Amino acid permease/ SLC12A domain-containing protein n=1 Tax=Halobacillus campisalis TaxID=435909 RepID=A0ABW2K3E0_9BACI|nr:hypothetical protein [Halobacillus campisalis]